MNTSDDTTQRAFLSGAQSLKERLYGPGGKNRVAFLGTDGGASASLVGVDEALKRVGMNTGNTIFQFALWNRIASPKTLFYTWNNPERIYNNFDAVVIPAANQLNPNWDLGWMADFIEKIDLPCVVLGLGAQADINEAHDIALKPGTVRFLQVLSNRTKTIGVRGEYTQKVAKFYGVTNTEVIGCPSQLINENIRGSDISAIIEKLKKSGIKKGLHLFGTMEEHTRETELVLAGLFRDTKHNVLFQTDKRIIKYLYNEEIEPSDKKFLNWLGDRVYPFFTPDQFLNYLADNGRCHFSARGWFDSMSSFDIALGMRIHGAVAAIHAKRLGVCVAFDSRTLELVTTMGYPYIRSSDLYVGMTWAELLDRIVFDPDNFDERKSHAFARMGSIFEESGINQYRLSIA